MAINAAVEKNNDISKAIAVTFDNYFNEILKDSKTLASVPLLRQSLKESIEKYDGMDIEERTRIIDERNEKWMEIDDVSDPFIQSYISNPVAEYLEYQEEVIPDWYGEIFLTNKYGELVASTSKLTTLAHGNKYWWLAAYDNGKGKPFFDDRGYDDSVDGYVLGAVVPVYEDGEVIGILKSNINIFNLIKSVIEDYAEVYKPSAMRIARSEGLIVYEEGTEPLSSSLGDNVMSVISEGKTMFLNRENERSLLSIASIVATEGTSVFGFGGNSSSIDHNNGNDGESWMVVLTMPEVIALEASKEFTRNFLIYSILLVIILIVASVFFIKRVTKPITELVLLTEEIGNGNLDKRINISSRDEVGRLGNSFNMMIDNINRTMASKAELSEEIEKRKIIEAKLMHLSTVDELTGLYNRRAFNDYLEKFKLHSIRYDEPLLAIMIDIDYFKNINDTYGHSVGDEVLKKLSEVLTDNVRDADVLARWGGEEFIILSPSLKLEAGYPFAERLREIIEKTVFSQDISLTVSIGITQLEKNDSNDDFLSRVDNAQYNAKAEGRNNTQML
jgi:diguanylate cyclase (GGDEF)-like protein